VPTSDRRHPDREPGQRSRVHHRVPRGDDAVRGSIM
jgi:hypothetical protein